MTMLLINRRPILDRLPQWFPDAPSELVVFTAPATLKGRDPADFADLVRHLEVAADYDGPTGTKRLAELCRSYDVQRILTVAEGDLVRAARLRAAFGLPGQDERSARAFTDKFAMKTTAAAAGIPVAPMRYVTDGPDLLDFVDAHGFPLVVKRLTGGGAVGMSVLGDRHAAQRFLARWTADGTPPAVLAEAWIGGEVYHVDGVMRDGSLLYGWPARYLNTQWENYHEAAPLVSGMLPAGDPLRSRLVEATAQVVAALPAAPGILPFHAEFFHTPHDTIVLCEVACRAGGAGITEVHELSFGLNLHQAGLLGQAGRSDQVTWHPLGAAHGHGWFLPQRGTLSEIPARCPLPGAVRYRTSGVPGRHYPGPRSANDSIAELIFRLPETHDLPATLRTVEEWWLSAVRWDRPGTRSAGR
jgi:biotin carboxylase